MCKTKKCAKCDKLYILKKPYPQRIQTCKNICKLRETCAICLLLFKASKERQKFKIQLPEVGQTKVNEAFGQ